MRTDKPQPETKNHNGYRFYVEGIGHNKRTDTSYGFDDWKRTWEQCMAIPQNDDHFKISILGIWDDELKQWINIDDAPAS